MKLKVFTNFALVLFSCAVFAGTASADERQMGDINGDGVVDMLDVGPFNDLIGTPPPEGGEDAEDYYAGDFDDDGLVTEDDVDGFIDALLGNDK